MKKLILILILGIFLIGIVGTMTYNIIDKNFTKEITKISIDGICSLERTLLGEYKSKECKEKEKEKEDKEKFDVEINQDVLSVMENPDTKVIRVAVNPPSK